MVDVIYNVKDEAVFDGMAVKLDEMTNREKEQFMALLQGYQEGVRVGMRIAENRHQDESA